MGRRPGLVHYLSGATVSTAMRRQEPAFDLLLDDNESPMMEILSCDQLAEKKCLPCEGGVAKFTPDEAAEQLKQLNGWELTGDSQRIRKSWVVTNFMAAIRFFEEVAKVSESEGHHPDLHLEQYRNVTIELWTHAIGGLSENDFICAAKIDSIPIELRSKS